MENRGGDSTITVENRGGDSTITVQNRGGDSTITVQNRGGDSTITVQNRGGDSTITVENRGGDSQHRKTLDKTVNNYYQTAKVSGNQGLCQDLETGCLKLAIVKFWGIQIFKGDQNILRFQP